MFGILNTDNYTSLHYNPRTGGSSREWIRYADNTFEPVRRFGNVNRKSRNKPGAPDWWVTERPLDWDPRDNGHDVTLNHSYGGKAKPVYDKEMENKPPRYSKLPYYGTGELHFAKMSADSDGGGGSDGGTKGGDGDPSGGGLDEEKGKAPKGGGSTLTQGSEGFWEMQAREKAAEQENASGDSDPRPHVFRGKVGSAKPGMDAGAKRESPGKHDRDYDWWVSRKMKNEEYDSGNDVFYPTEDARVTSGFGERIHPVTKKVSQHKAVDYGQNPNGVGKNVYATVDGEIVDVGTSKDGSNFVVI